MLGLRVDSLGFQWVQSLVLSQFRVLSFRFRFGGFNFVAPKASCAHMVSTLALQYLDRPLSGLSIKP